MVVYRRAPPSCIDSIYVEQIYIYIYICFCLPTVVFQPIEDSIEEVHTTRYIDHHQKKTYVCVNSLKVPARISSIRRINHHSFLFFIILYLSLFLCTDRHLLWHKCGGNERPHCSHFYYLVFYISSSSYSTYYRFLPTYSFFCFYFYIDTPLDRHTSEIGWVLVLVPVLGQ